MQATMLRLSRHSSILKSTQRLLLHTTSLRPEDPSFGRVVEGIDLGNLDKATLDECVALVYRYGLVVFRGQEQLSPFDELSFAKAFNHDTSGEQQSYTGGAAPQAKLPPPLDDIAVIGSFELENYHGLEKASSGGVYPPWPKGQLSWHVDGYADTNPPPDLTIMRCIETPTVGGETLFRCARKQAARLAPTTAAGGGGAAGFPSPGSGGGKLLMGGTVPADCVRVQYRLAAETKLKPMGYSLDWASSQRRADKGETYQQGNSEATLVNEAEGTDWPLVLREPTTGERCLVSTYHVASACVLDPFTGKVVQELGFDAANELVNEAWSIQDQQEEGDVLGGGVTTTAPITTIVGPQQLESEDEGCPAPHPDVYAHFWEKGDLVAWSNRLAIHTAVSTKPYAGQTRIHHRIRLRAAEEFRPKAWLPGVAHSIYEERLRLRDE